MDSKAARRALPSHCCLPERWPHGWPGYVPPPINPAHLVTPKPMYLVTVPGRWLFFWNDPGRPGPHGGCTLPVVEGVDLIELPINNDEWAAGKAPERVYAQSKRQPLKFKAFRSELDVPNAWDILDGNAEVWATWEAFSRVRAPSSPIASE